MGEEMMREIKERILQDMRITAVGEVRPHFLGGWLHPFWERGDELFGDERNLDGGSKRLSPSGTWVRFEMDGGRVYGMTTITDYMVNGLGFDSKGNKTAGGEIYELREDPSGEGRDGEGGGVGDPPSEKKA